MKKYLCVLMSLLATLVVFAEDETRGFIVEVGDQVDTNITFVLSDSSEVGWSDFNGKPVLLQFTASWCGVCRKEMPHIEKEIWQKWKNEGLNVIGVDRDEPIETVRSFKEKVGVTYPLALDPGAEIFAKFASKKSGVTRNVLIDSNGTIVQLTRLFDEEEFNSLVQTIDRLMKSE